MSLSRIAHLDSEEKRRYLNKVDILGEDPYSIPKTRLTPIQLTVHLPDLAFHDIYIYLIHNPSPYTGKQLKAHKSTEAYRNFRDGWVKEVKSCHIKSKTFVFTGRVSNSLMNFISVHINIR